MAFQARLIRARCNKFRFLGLSRTRVLEANETRQLLHQGWALNAMLINNHRLSIHVRRLYTTDQRSFIGHLTVTDDFTNNAPVPASTIPLPFIDDTMSGTSGFEPFRARRCSKLSERLVQQPMMPLVATICAAFLLQRTNTWRVTSLQATIADSFLSNPVQPLKVWQLPESLTIFG